MASYYAKDVLDNATFYHREFIVKGKVIDLSHAFRNYSCYDDFQNPEMKDTGEKTFNYPLQVGRYSNYQRDALNNPESYTTGNLLIEAKSYWAMVKDGWMIDSRQPGYSKRAPSNEIVSIHDAHRRNMWNSFYENEEIAKWTLAASPNDGSGGVKIRCNGIPNYIVKASAAAPARVTAAPTGYTLVDNVNRTTYPQAGNYGAQYTSMTEADERMYELFWLMGWKPPVPVGATEKPTQQYEICSTFTFIRDYKKLLRASNTDVGTDFGKFYGSAGSDANSMASFQGVPMKALDVLTSSTLRDGRTNDAADETNPIYMLDKSTWKIIAGEGEFLQEDEPHMKDNPKRMVSFDLFSMHNRVCINPSANAVLHDPS